MVDAIAKDRKLARQTIEEVLLYSQPWDDPGAAHVDGAFIARVPRRSGEISCLHKMLLPLVRDHTEMIYVCTCQHIGVSVSPGLIDDIAFPDACEEVMVVQFPFTPFDCVTSILGPDTHTHAQLFRNMYIPTRSTHGITCWQVLSRAALWRLGAEKILATPSMEEGATVLGSLTRSALRKYLLEFEDDKCRVMHEVAPAGILFSVLAVTCMRAVRSLGRGRWRASVDTK